MNPGRFARLLYLNDVENISVFVSGTHSARSTSVMSRDAHVRAASSASEKLMASEGFRVHPSPAM